jgi:hypothetical protein
VYLKGFTDGVMVVGEHAGKKVRALWLLRCGCCAVVAAVGWWYHVRLFCSCFFVGLGATFCTPSLRAAAAAAAQRLHRSRTQLISNPHAPWCLQVSEAKPLCKAEMIAAGEAILYSGGRTGGCVGACWASGPLVSGRF